MIVVVAVRELKFKYVIGALLCLNNGRAMRYYTPTETVTH